MSFDNLPGIFDFKIDGNLGAIVANANPIVLILGTAEKGDAETLVSISRTSAAAKTFGKEGTLLRGALEAAGAGALNIKLMRIGATAAKLTLVGGGITIETVSKDDSAGTDYKIYWNDTSDRLLVYRADDDELVYDNYPAYPEEGTDLGEVVVTGSPSGNPGDIGSSGTPITLAAAHNVTGAQYTPGTDGLSLSRMELWQALYDAYQLLEDADLDFVVPMNAYLDDINTQDMTNAEVSTFNTSAPWAADATNYPDAGSTYDGLGKVFVQEYNGKNYFWWDMDRDGIAELHPSVGSSGATADADGETIASGDYHEVNFGYELARFCFDKSENNDEIIGFIGMKPPASFGLADVSSWVGKVPTTEEDADGVTIIDTNGTGLLGNKWMNGRLGNGSSGLPAFSIDGVDGRSGGGFIAHDGLFMDSDDELVDNNDKLVDLGKYISVVGAQATLSNTSQDAAYVSTGAATYAGFVSSLQPNSAPTNKILSGARLPFRISLTKLDALAGAGYVMFQLKPKGVVVSDAPTAARTESDYNRLTTVRIVKAVLDAVRAVGDPFLGEGLSGARLAALETAIEGVLSKLLKAGFLKRYEHKITSSPADQVLGKATVELTLVPAFELRQITVVVSLASS